jgi:hypothetical protein
LQLKPASVWDVLEKTLGMHKEQPKEEEKSKGEPPAKKKELQHLAV